MLKKEIFSEKEMLAFGAQLALCLKNEGILFLSGELGAGKTTLCRGILRSMGYLGAVKSPTFTLVEPYEFADSEVYHFDLYRLVHPDELEYIGIDDYFGANKLCLIEWPNRGTGQLPSPDLDINIDVLGEKRIIYIKFNSESGEKTCAQLIETYESL